jgi:hypothetical protein
VLPRNKTYSTLCCYFRQRRPPWCCLVVHSQPCPSGLQQLSFELQSLAHQVAWGTTAVQRSGSSRHLGNSRGTLHVEKTAVILKSAISNAVDLGKGVACLQWELKSNELRNWTQSGLPLFTRKEFRRWERPVTRRYRLLENEFRSMNLEIV